ICPIGNSGLVASEETDRCANAMNSRTCLTVSFEVKPKFFLDSASQANYDVAWATDVYEVHQGIIAQALPIFWRNIAVILCSWIAVGLQPRQVSLHGGFGRHDPNHRTGGAELRVR